MGRLIKYLIYLIVLAFLGLVAYAYVGPYLGVSFAPPQTEKRAPVTLNTD